MPLDIAVGLGLAFLVHALLGVPFTAWLAIFGVAATLLPDIDIVTTLFGEWRHRTITHYPLLYIPLFVLAFLFAPLPYATLFTLGILAHFIHDTIGAGWGISWFWPFTPRRFLLFPYKRRTEMGTFATWLPNEHPEWAHTGPHTWVKNMYFRPSLIALIEYGAFAIVLVLLATYIW